MPEEEKAAATQKVLIEKLAIYFGKMAMHDYEMQGATPSLVAVGALYVCLKVIEHLKKVTLITKELTRKLVASSKYNEQQIAAVSQKMLHIAQHFEELFPGLENLKKSHFVNITPLL